MSAAVALCWSLLTVSLFHLVFCLSFSINVFLFLRTFTPVDNNFIFMPRGVLNSYKMDDTRTIPLTPAANTVEDGGVGAADTILLE